MARGLADVLHYFVAETPVAEPTGAATPAARRPILGVPLAGRDVVRAALAWNLAVEAARLGVRSTLVAPSAADAASLWPDAGKGPLGAELIVTFAEDLAELAAAAQSTSASPEETFDDGGLVVVHVPPPWIEKAPAPLPLLRHVLLFASPERSDLAQTYSLLKRCVAAGAERIGVTIHGVRSVIEAEEAFLRLARASERHLGRPIESYGLLVDDLNVYRSIVSRRPIGLTHPHSPAARALRDVANLLVGDLRGGAFD